MWWGRAGRRKADPSPTFAKGRRAGFGMTLGEKRQVKSGSLKTGHYVNQRCRPEGTALQRPRHEKRAALFGPPLYTILFAALVLGYAPAFLVAWASSWMAARTLLITSGVMLCMLWAVLACSLAFLRTSSSELPRSSTLHPGTTSPHFRTLVMRSLLALGGKGIVGPRG